MKMKEDGDVKIRVAEHTAFGFCFILIIISLEEG